MNKKPSSSSSAKIMCLFCGMDEESLSWAQKCNTYLSFSIFLKTNLPQFYEQVNLSFFAQVVAHIINVLNVAKQPLNFTLLFPIRRVKISMDPVKLNILYHYTVVSKKTYPNLAAQHMESELIRILLLCLPFQLLDFVRFFSVVSCSSNPILLLLKMTMNFVNTWLKIIQKNNANLMLKNTIFETAIIKCVRIRKDGWFECEITSNVPDPDNL